MSQNEPVPHTEVTTGQAPAATAASEIGLDAKRMMQYDANKKSTLVAYLLWFFLGWFGAHRFYIGTGTAFAILLTFLVGAALSWLGVGLLILLIPLHWLLVDMFLIPSMVRDKNKKLIQMLS